MPVQSVSPVLTFFLRATSIPAKPSNVSVSNTHNEPCLRNQVFFSERHFFFLTLLFSSFEASSLDSRISTHSAQRSSFVWVHFSWMKSPSLNSFLTVVKASFSPVSHSQTQVTFYTRTALTHKLAMLLCNMKSNLLSLAFQTLQYRLAYPSRYHSLN